MSAKFCRGIDADHPCPHRAEIPPHPRYIRCPDCRRAARLAGKKRNWAQHGAEYRRRSRLGVALQSSRGPRRALLRLAAEAGLPVRATISEQPYTCMVPNAL